MGSEARSIDYEGISEAMEVLANPNRLRILRQLLEPRTVGEIEITPERSGGPGEPATTASREGVRQHLEKLRELGVVRRREASRPRGRVHEYLVDHAQLYALTERFRRLGLLQPRERWGTETLAGTQAFAKTPTEGVRLVVVRGLVEGQAFPLGRTGSWRIGRSEEADVVLDFDPFVSSVNSVIEADGDGFRLRDLPRSRNGTAVNWEKLPDGGSTDVEPGDVIGVGRSLLLLRT